MKAAFGFHIMWTLMMVSSVFYLYFNVLYSNIKFFYFWLIALWCHYDLVYGITWEAGPTTPALTEPTLQAHQMRSLLFHNLKNFQKHVERAARIWGTWKEDNKWDERSLSEMYVSIRNLFNFETVKKARKSKRLEQQSWETVYWKLKKRKSRLVGEEEEQQQ